MEVQACALELMFAPHKRIEDTNKPIKGTVKLKKVAHLYGTPHALKMSSSVSHRMDTLSAMRSSFLPLERTAAFSPWSDSDHPHFFA